MVDPQKREANREVLEQVFGTVRPVFILVTAWVMATAQVLKKHTATVVRYNAFLLLPAYHVFYQGFLISSLFFLYHRHRQALLESQTMDCSDYKMETRMRFGFIKNPTIVERFIKKTLIIFAISMIAGVVAAYLVKNDLNGWRPKNLAEYRRVFAYYSIANIGLCLLAYFAITEVFMLRVPAEAWDEEIPCVVTDNQ